MADLFRHAKDLVNVVLGRFGVRLMTTQPQLWHPTLAGGLLRIVARHQQPHTLIDVGAADGAWSRQAVAALPACRDLLLLEAQAVHRPALDMFQRDFPQAHVVLAVAGDQDGEVSFDANNPWDGAASRTPQAGGTWTTLRQTTIDHEVAQRQLRGPFLIKLDVHGYERPILAGAAATLAQTDAVIVECYNAELGREAQRFPAFCAHMESLGFRCADLWDPIYVEPQHLLWQFDLLFLRRAAVAPLDRTGQPA